MLFRSIKAPKSQGALKKTRIFRFQSSSLQERDFVISKRFMHWEILIGTPEFAKVVFIYFCDICL